MTTFYCDRCNQTRSDGDLLRAERAESDSLRADLARVRAEIAANPLKQLAEGVRKAWSPPSARPWSRADVAIVKLLKVIEDMGS